MPDIRRISQKMATISKLFIQHQLMRYSFNNNRYVLNRGVNGDNSFDLLRRLPQDVLAHKPNAVIMMVGTNDALNVAQLVDIEQYHKNLLKLVEEITSRGISLLLMTPPMADDEIAQSPNKVNLTCNQLLQPYREQVISVAKDTQTPCLDLFGAFESANKPKSYLMNLSNSSRNDGVHPTAEGYTFIAQSIYKKMHEVHIPISRIICYGDSITFGYLVKGEGLETGETYPAVLNRMLLPK